MGCCVWHRTQGWMCPHIGCSAKGTQGGILCKLVPAGFCCHIEFNAWELFQAVHSQSGHSLFSLSLPKVPPQLLHLSKKNREGKTTQDHKALRIPALGLFERLSPRWQILTRGNDLTWRSPKPLARGLGPRAGERGLALIYSCLQCLAWPQPCCHALTQLPAPGSMLHARPVQRRMELAFHSLLCAGQQKEKLVGVRARIVVKLGLPGSSRRCSRGGGAGWMHSKVNISLLCLPAQPALHPWSLHLCHFIPVVFSVGSWLGCWCSCRAPGPKPAPARWREALRRAALHSLSRLPLFNQIIGKVNLLDSRSAVSPPSPTSPCTAPLPTAPSSILGTGPGILFFEQGTKGSCQCLSGFALPPLSFFFFVFIL